ncbi:MAG: hemolysin family protein, partial [Lentisphaeria bacterium]|nr:hemolysin family protein [Lentisphaeria bacterium]
LAEASEKLIEKKLSLEIALQLESFLSVSTAVALFTSWFLRITVPLWMRWTSVATLFLGFSVAYVLVDQLLSLKGTATLLLNVHPVARLFSFLGMPFQKLEDVLDEQISSEEDSTATAEDAIRVLVEENQQKDGDSSDLENNLEQDEKRMLTGVMNLDETLVHEIMTPRVDMDVISQDSTVREAKAAIARSGHSRIPLYGKSIDAITGILYAKDLLDESKTMTAQCVRDVAHAPIFIPETSNVAELLNDFRSKHNHVAVVLDEYGGTSGIVTIEDILEEIVGEIEDEFDRNKPLPQAQLAQDGTLTLDARTTIWEINQIMSLEIPEDDGYDTLAGYIMSMLGRIPRIGETIETPALIVDIISASPRRLITLKIRKRDAEKNE